MSPDSHLLPISLATLRPSPSREMDLYLGSEDGHAPILFCARHQTLERDPLHKLMHAGVTKLYIAVEDRDNYQDYLRGNLRDWLEDDEAPSAQRVAAINELVRDVLSDSFQAHETTRIVDAAHQLGSQVASVVSGRTVVVRDMMRMLHHDYTTFTHSANVAYYAAALANELGYVETDVAQIATGGILHDLGKLGIQTNLLTKPGRLEQGEFREIKRHPLIGFQMLGHRTDLSDGQLMMVYQHHERLNGSGYPVGCEGDEIHAWAKICAVVDVFEALTSERPYRSPLSHEAACAVLLREQGQGFDPEILECWNRMILADSISS